MNRLSVAVFFLAIISPGILIALDADGVKSSLLKVSPNLPIETIADSPIKGFYLVSLAGGQLLHVTEDAQYFVAGDLYSLAHNKMVNLSELSRNKRRRELINGVDEAEMVIFAPDKTKKTVTVFTDVDCTYCRKLHQEVPKMNELGIAVRYLAYPRAGIPSPSYDKIQSAWCAEDPHTALTMVKAGQTIPQVNCTNPIANHLKLGEEIGVSGTPALVTETGELLPGYMPAESLAARLGIN